MVIMSFSRELVLGSRYHFGAAPSITYQIAAFILM